MSLLTSTRSHHNESETINYWAVVKEASVRKEQKEHRKEEDCAKLSDHKKDTHSLSSFWLISVCCLFCAQKKGDHCSSDWVAICGHFIIHWCHSAHYYLLLSQLSMSFSGLGTCLTSDGHHWKTQCLLQSRVYFCAPRVVQGGCTSSTRESRPTAVI